MSEVLLADRLDQAIDAILSSAGAQNRSFDDELAVFLDVATVLKLLPRADFKAELRSAFTREDSMTSAFATTEDTVAVRQGYRTVTPYLTVPDIHAEVEFLTKAFDASGQIHGLGSAGGFHSEYNIGGSMLMIGGGGKGAKWKGTPQPSALHLYVPDVDAAYERAIKAGATALMPPTDQSYGDRDAAIRDVGGNHWYLGTHKGESYIPEGALNLMPYLHPVGAPAMIKFLTEAFAAEELGIYRSPDGIVRHARMRVGSSIIEMGEAHEQWKSMPMTFMLYVNDCDAWYERAIEAEGAIAVASPSAAPYGGRTGILKDAFENTWYLSTP